MAGLTFINQTGAIDGMNQAAPGTLIPDTFVRWSQDVLFDRAGLMRRRGPFKEFKLYKSSASGVAEFDFTDPSAANERILGILSTYDPVGAERIGMLVSLENTSGVYSTILRVFDNSFTFLGEETLPFNITPLSIITVKPALGGGVWISAADSPANSSTHYQFFWRGGYSKTASSITGNFTLETNNSFSSEHNVINQTISSLSSTSDVSAGQFVYANKHCSVTNKALTSNVVTLTTSVPHGFAVGDSVTVSGIDATFNGTYTISTVSDTTFTYAKTASNVASASASGKVLLNKDYYIGVVKSVSSATSSLTLEKRPFIWNDTIDNNHNIALTPNNLSASAGTATIRVNEAMLFEVGDVVYVNTGTSAYNGSHTITAINTTPAVGLQTFSYTLGSTPSTVTSPTGTVYMDKDLSTLSLSSVSLKCVSVRPYTHRHGRGLLTIADGDGNTIISGTAGTSGDGHWQAANVAGYNLYRASDNAYIGKVNTITSNVAATLHSDCGINLNGEEYIMRSTDNAVITGTPIDFCVGADPNNTPYNFAGLYTAVYAGYQWFGNFAQTDKDTNRVVFSAYHDREAVDLSRDAADSIIFPGKSKFRGMGASNAGLLVFLEDRTYIIRGNDRTNFSVEQLMPEGCLCPSSIVEWGGGVFWAGKSGIMYFDGASIRNLTRDNLGLYYTDSLDTFDAETDRVIGFMHKNNLVMHYTSWNSPFKPIRYEPVYASDYEALNPGDYPWTNLSGFTQEDWSLAKENNTPVYWDRTILNSVAEGNAASGLSFKWNDGTKWGDTNNLYKWGPVRQNTSITFCIYLPTNALTTLSNIDYRGVANLETDAGIKTIVGVNSIESGELRARIIDIHPVFDTITNGIDDLLIEKINQTYTDSIKGPDFYLQTKHYTVGDTVLRKWFQRVMFSMLLYGGCLRMDMVDDDDNDMVDISKKKHQYWELFTSTGYDWDYLTNVQFPKITSPSPSKWQKVETAGYIWDDVFTADFNRYMKRFSWRKSSIGFRLYQLNQYKERHTTGYVVPTQVELQAISLGFKPMRQGRV